MLAVMGACAWGAWGLDLSGELGTVYIISDTETITPTDGATYSVAENETITLTGDLTVENLRIYTNVTIDLAGYKLNVTNFWLGGQASEEDGNSGAGTPNTGIGTRAAALKISDSSLGKTGLVTIKNYDTANNQSTSLTLDTGVTVKITGECWVNTNTSISTSVAGGYFDISDVTGGSSISDISNVAKQSTVIDSSSATTGVETDTYYWTGNANDGNVWTTSGNWAANTAGTAVNAGTYPGHADGEKAIFSVSATVENLTVVANAGLSVIGDFIISGTTSIGGNSSLTFNGKVTNNGSIDCSNATVTFNGDYSAGSASIFTASTGNTIFYGNADFSEMSSTNFTEPVAGTIYFITTGKTLTTCTGQSFSTLYLGGTSTLDIGSGGAGGTKILMHTDSSVVPFLTSASVVTITGSGKLTCTTNLEIDRISSTGGVTGTLKIDCDVDTPVLYTHSGTNLVVNSGKTLTITSTFTDNSSSTDKNSFTINGILDASGVSSLSFSGYSSLVVNEGGTLTANSISNTTKITNSGTIQTASLRANVLESGTTSAPLGTLEITGDGKLTITNSDAETSWLNNVIIDNGNTLTLENDITVYGDWTNNNETGGLDSNSKTVTFAGEDMTVSGSQTFANAVFSGNGTEITGGNTFSTATFNADTSISGNNTFTNFLCTTGGVTLTFGAGKTQTVTGNFTITGASAASPVTLQSSASGSEWRIFAPIATASVSYATVSDSVSTNYAILAQNSVDSGNNTSWNFEDFTYTWTGASSSSPTEKSNWSPASLPGTKANVLIPDSTTDKPISNYPKFSLAATSEVKNLTIGTSGTETHSAYLHVAGAGNLKISGILTNYGTIKYSASGKIVGNSGTFLNDVGNNGTVEYLTTAGTLSISDFGDVDYANLVISGAWTLDSAISVAGKLTVSGTGALDGANSLSISGNAEISGAIGSSTPLSSLSVVGNSSIEANVSVSGALNFGVVQNVSNSVTLTANSIGVSGSSSFADLIIDSPSVTFSEGNFFGNLKFNSGCTAKFGAGKIQSVTGTLASLGTESKPNTLTTDSGSASEDDDTTWWILNITSDKGKAISSSDFTYTTVAYSKSENDIVHEWASSIVELPEGSTFNWFSSEYYWLGGTDETSGSKWEVSENWKHKDSSDVYYSVRKFPTYSTGRNSIFIATGEGNKDLVLENDVIVKLLTVNASKTLNVADKAVSVVDDFTNNGTVISSGAQLSATTITNNGTFRLTGSEIISGTMENGAESTVSYYGSAISSLPWDGNSTAEGKNYQNLVFESGAAGSVSDKVSVTGTTQISNGTGNTISLTGANLFGDTVTLSDAGNVTLSGENIFSKPIIITSGGAITLNSSANLLLGTSTNPVSCGSLNLLCNATSQNSMTIANALSLADGKTLTASGNISCASLTNGGTIDIGGNALSFTLYQGNSGDTDIIKANGGTISASGTDALTIGKVESSGSSTLKNTGTASLTVSSFAKSGDTAAVLFLKGGTSGLTISNATYGGTAITGTGKVTLTGTTESDSMGNLIVGDDTTAGNVSVSGALNVAQVAVEVGSLTIGGNTRLSSVSIASGASFLAGENSTDEYEITVSGAWTNNNDSGGFTANASTVKITGNGVSVTGSQTFANAVFNGSGTEITGANTFSTATFNANTTISGSNTFENFICENGGATITFGAGNTQTINENLTLKGSEENLLELHSSSDYPVSRIVVPVEKFVADYLSIEKNIEIKSDSSSAPVPGRYLAPDSSLASGATFADVYKNGWNFPNTIYRWIGTTSDWNSVSNWDIGVVPDSIGTVEYSGTESVQPVLNVDVAIKKITIPENKTLSLGGHNFTVTGEFSNSGTTILNGTEAVALPAGKVTENGTWHYHGSGSGSVKAIENLSYKNLVISGTIGVADDYEITASDGIVLGTDSDEVTINGDARFASSVTLVNDASFLGNGSFTDFICETGGITLTFGDGKTQAISGNLVLKGREENLLELTSTDSSYIQVPAANISADYLSVGMKIQVKEGDSVTYGSHKAYTSSASSYPSSGSQKTDYAVIYKNGWNLGYAFTYVWQGGASGSADSWNVEKNWDIEIIPGLNSANSQDAAVVIPEACTYWPLVDLSSLQIKNLEIASGAKVTLDSYVLAVSGTLTNYGTIEYKGSGRITNGTIPVNDVANGGTVLYSGGSAESPLTVTAFADGSGNDYVNLLVSGIAQSSEAISVGGNVLAKSGAELTVNGGLTVNGNVSFEGKFLVSAGDFSAVNLTFSGSGSFTPASGSTVTISDSWDNSAGGSFVHNDSTVNFTGENFSISGDNTFYDVTFPRDNAKIAVTGANSFHAATFTGANFDITFSDSNTFDTLSFTGAGSSVKFAAGKTQTVTGTLSSLGTNEKPNLLTTNATSPSETDNTSWWILNIPSDKGKAISSSNFAYTTISYSKSENDITHDWDSSIEETPEGSTSNWFSSEYYWIGGMGESDGSKWSVDANWRHKDSSDNYYLVRKFPTYNTNLNTILIATEDGNKDLVLENDVSVKLLTVNEGKTIDLKGYKVNADDSSDSTADFVNNGTVRLYGVSGQIDSSVSNGESSTIEYYVESSGLTSSLVWGDSYINLNIFSPFSMTEDVTILKNLTLGKKGSYGAAATSENKFTVAGSTLIANGSGNSISLTAANSFGDVLTIGSETVPAGDITLSGENTFAGGLSLVSGGNIVLNGKKDSESYFELLDDTVCSKLILKSPVILNGNVTTTGSQTYRGNISLKTDIDFTAGAGITFETEGAGGLAISSVTGDKSAVFKNEVSMACDMEIKALASLSFEDSVTTDSNLRLSVPSVDFAENAAFSQSDSTKTLSLLSGSLSFKAASFEAGRLEIAQNASFMQSGENISPAEQTVHGIENNGICVWDSGSEGGSLVLAGSIGGEKAGEVVFNKKNVSISQSPVTIAGVFYDLEIPTGVTATNGSSLAVRRNFTVSGTYAHNDKPLTLGSITLADERKFASENNEDGSSGRIEIERDSNLGSVTVAQETSGKTFASEIVASFLGLNDTTPSAGKILFEKKVTAESLTNESGSDFDIEISEACDISQAVSFGTSGKVILGSEETSDCNFTGELSHTGGKTRLAGKLKAAAAEFARTILTKNTVIDTGSNNVVFSGMLDSESAESPSSLVIGSETSASSAVFGGEVGSVAPLLSLEVKGNANFGENVTTTGSQTYGGKAILEGDVVFDALDNLISFGSTVESKDGVISSLTLKSPVSLNGNVTTTESQTYRGNISLKADVDFTAGSGIIFETESAGGLAISSVTGDKSAVFKNEVNMTCDMEIKELASLSFEDSVTTDSNLSLSVPSVDFAENAAFSQSDSTKTISLGDGTVLSFKAASFEAGRLEIAQNASFTQSGKNISPAEQTVHGIENNGICVWDSGSEGGSLVLAGSIVGEKAGEVVFNKKNVSISQSPVTISGVFYDLTIPAGVTATNGSSLAVRRNFTVSGTYAHNEKPLTLGSITLSDGRKFESENNDDGSSGRIIIESLSNLGSVTVAQETSGKTFVSEIVASSLGLDDKTASAGKILFEKKVTAESLTNESGSGFEIEISEACDISQAVSFGTSGKVILGSEETSECNFTGELSHTGGETRLAGKLKAASAEFARTLLTKNTVIDTGSNEVVFSGKLDSESAESPSSLVIGSETSASSVVFGGEVGSVAPLLSLEVKGNASFGGSLTCQSTITFMGDVLSNASGVNLTSQKSYILANGTVSRKWGAESGSLTVASDLFADISSDATLSIESDLLFSKNLVLYSGNFSAGAVNLSVSEDFAIFGSSYSADDPRYSGSDNRFAYYKYTLQDGLAYKPESGEAAFASRFDTSGTKISVGKNFYANGLDFDNCSLLLPDNSNSNPSFNSSSEVTEKQWGSPYAIVFNSSISNCTAKASVDSASAFVAAATFQNVTDDSGNSGFQFDIPKIAEAYSVSDSVICISFDMALENSQKEVQKTVALVSSLLEGGIFYNGGTVAFDGFFYTKTDGTDCSIPLSDSAFASSDIPAGTKLYLKVSSLGEKWNTDATASSYGNSDSSDRGGEHHEVTTDLSMFEGLFYAAQGKTMCRNYGIGLWKDDSAYVTSKTFPTIDRARPVLIDVFTGQELYSTNTGSAESQKPYDSHNFIELRYSEPVDIGDLLSGSTSENQNIQAEKNFASSQSHGGSILKNGSGLSVTGFVSIAQGSVEAGFRNGSSHEIDTAKAHALYRKFQRNAKVAESVEPCRIRISIAGFVDIDNPVTIDGKSFNNWIGYIDSSESPAGLVQPFANPYITDLAVDAEGNALKNALDEKNSSRTITVNSASSSISSDCLPDSLYSLYGAWDCTHPSFSPYITSLSGGDGYSWTDGDSDSRTYEIVGMVDSNVSAYLDHVEFHLFDNQPEYKSDDTYKWVSQLGWMENGSELPSHIAPESTGGARPFAQGVKKSQGGIRRSSLAEAYSAFDYSYATDGIYSDYRTFNDDGIFQHVKSSLFRNKDLTVTSTNDDGLYIAMHLNSSDSKLPMRTNFIIRYYQEKSFITDLAGNRLLHSDDGSVKTLRSVDITPPSFSIVLSPVGEDKLYAVFTKPLAYDGQLLQDRADLPSVMEKIRDNLEFVYSAGDDIDTGNYVSGEDEIAITKVELASYSADYTSLLFTLDRKIRLNDVEKIWLRINEKGDEIETFSGKLTASYFRDISGNSIPYHTCHAISDFAANSVNVLYARSLSDEDEGWDEQGIYGSGVNSLASDYAAHDFSAEGGNYGKLRTGHDIIFQLQLVGGVDSDGYYGFKNDESLALVIDKKSNLRNEWISDKFNLLTKKDWRIWLDKPLPSLASSYNSSPLSRNPVFEKVTGSDLLENMTLKNDEFNFASKEEYQFFFKILDKDGNPILINHDGDKTTQKIPLYALWMPQEKISSGDFSFLDLWSFTLSSITRQRGGVTILNNVIDASVGEKTAIEVDMASSGNLNVFIMTLDGNIVQHLAKGSFKAGKHYFYWDGRNKGGSPVARGLYFVRVSGKGIDETRKVMVVK